MSDPPAPPPPPAASAPPGLPWEDRALHGGAVAAFVETLRLLVLAPVEAFARARRRGELVSPIAYAVLLGWIGVVAERLWSLLIGTSLLELFPGSVRESALFGMAVSGVVLVVALVLMPIFLLVALFVWGGILHLFLVLYGGTRDSPSGFEGTIRALSWSATAQLGQIVPFAGGLVVLVWSIVLQTLGLAALHRTTNGRALAAVLSPLLLCCVCLGFFFAGALALVFGAVAGNR
jgi:hypothetical protein